MWKPFVFVVCATLCLTACLDDAAIYEKGGPVTAEGYVDLSPPTTFSPKRGVLCESYSINAVGAPTGECYDLSGPSVSLTRHYISPIAAELLLGDIEANRFPNPNRFKTGNGMVCDLDTQKCWLKRKYKSNLYLPQHTKALFWE